MTKSRLSLFLAGAILLFFLLVLNRYGTAIPPAIPPEEVNFAGLARNIAEGRGALFAVPSEIVPSPEEHPRRFYVPVLSYAFALSGWGSFWGFDLLPLRWFNRVLGALDLLLLIGLARRWGVPRYLALLAAFWTSMDILYQMASNLVRSDAFSLLWVLLGLWAFTEGWERRETGWHLASGLCFAIALFAHFWQVFLLVAWLALILLWRRRWGDLVVFIVPSALFSLLWLLFALLDWEWFRFLSGLAVQDKASEDRVVFAFRLLGLHVSQSVLGVFPSDTPPWLGVLLLLTWAGLRRHLSLFPWQWGVFWIAYGVAYANPHPWYVGWFVPIGYLALALLAGQVLIPRTKGRSRYILAALALLWSGYQALQVGRCWQAAPALHRAYQQFFQNLAADLPQDSALWLNGTVPDPSFFLFQARPDLRLYIGSGYNTESDLKVDGIISAFREEFPEMPSYRVRQKWRLPGIVRDFSVLWVERLPGD